MKRIKDFFLENSTAIVGYFIGLALGCIFMTAVTQHAIEKYTAKQETQSVLNYIPDTVTDTAK